MITRALDQARCETIIDGAIVVEGGIIAEVGTYEALSGKHRHLPVIGTANDIAVPGFVNAHHHVGVTPFQLGAPDLPLELWVIARMSARSVDPYLDTLYGAFELVSSGVTTVQHIIDTAEGSVAEVKGRIDAVIRAYETIGLRASICYGIADQNHFVHQANSDFLAGLPKTLAHQLAAQVERIEAGLEGGMEIFDALYAEHRQNRRIRVQLAPANLHWCSDQALKALARASQDYNVPLHMHLLETPFQRDYALKRFGKSAFAVLGDFGLHSPRLTLGHGTWMTPADIAAAAEAGCSVCINCSSNLRLRSGRAPVNRLAAAGVNLAVGMDEAGLNDDHDMLQEMRLVQATYGEPGPSGGYPGTGQIFRMATTGGAATTPHAGRIGTIAPGQCADIVLLDWRRIVSPLHDSDHPLADIVLRRAKSGHVTLVMCDGTVIYEKGIFTQVDRDATVRELRQSMRRALTPYELDQKSLAAKLAPFVRRYYGFSVART